MYVRCGLFLNLYSLLSYMYDLCMLYYIYWLQFTDGYVVYPSRSVHINTETVVMCFELSLNDVL